VDELIDKPLSLHDSAIYQIRFQGHLGQNWAREVGMEIDNFPVPGDSAVTTLVGELADQAALFGVLNRLYGLGYPLLSVECILPIGPASSQSEALSIES
jgi:hypothetical protein